VTGCSHFGARPGTAVAAPDARRYAAVQGCRRGRQRPAGSAEVQHAAVGGAAPDVYPGRCCSARNSKHQLADIALQVLQCSCSCRGVPGALLYRSSLILLPAEHYPVAICGGGPTGLTLSALLAKLGVPSVLFERAETLPQHPQVELALLLSTTLEQARVCDLGAASRQLFCTSSADCKQQHWLNRHEQSRCI